MKLQFIWLAGVFVFLLGATVYAQDEEAPPAEGGEGEGDKGEDECEEAWDYLEFLKSSVKEKIETILQDVLFEPRNLLEETVTETMEKTLEIRDEILARTKAIRTKDESITICEDQNIKQEEFLTQVRMEVMSVLLALIDKEAASKESLQDIGRTLLAIRTKVNGEITRMIMLRSATVRSVAPAGECDCGILGEVVDDLDAVTGEGEKEDKENEANVVDGEASEESNEESGESGEDPIEAITATLMKIDAEIRGYYNAILSELDEAKREELSQKLLELKQISTDLHAIISKMVELDPEEDADALKRLVKRDVKGLRNDVDRLLKACQRKCPGECSSCGSEKIVELKQKLEEYKANIEQLEEEDAKEAVRADLMAYLTSTSSEMTELLKKKAEDGELDECDNEKLDVISKIKGPLWMTVNITIFGDAGTLSEMITALEGALDEMNERYCGAETETRVLPEPDTDDCDIQEIDNARDWIIDIDTIISENLFKGGDDESRKNAMLGFIDLKSAMDDRVRKLFQNNLQCKEEVEQIKNVYSDQLTQCLAELMNPRLRFEELDRSKKVQCIKQLRVTIEDRRGELLMREIEKKIQGLNDAAQEGS